MHRTDLTADWALAQPLIRASSLPAELYTDPAVQRVESERIFARSWQLFAHASQLVDGGDHVVGNVAGVPLIAVRGDDGILRAFHNVCRHRAGPLATCDGRGAKALRCRYHGWTYTLAGQLRSAPEMAEAEDFDATTIALPPVRIETWQGMAFVALDDVPPLTDVVSGIDARMTGHLLADYRFHHRTQYEIACNWKVYVDNYLEGYHVPHIHPALNRMLDYRGYVTETAAWYSLQSSPMEASDAANASNFYGDGEALYYFIYPNTMLNILPGRLQTNRVIPLAPDRCRVEFDFFYPAGDDPAERLRRERDDAFSDEVQQEDVHICVEVQRGLASGSYRPGRLCPRRESGVHHFQELIRQAWRNAPVRAPA
ncbi:MAG: SRPBCC family protein [Tahibacter sp.]